MDALNHIFNLDEFRKQTFDRSMLARIFVEYDSQNDLIDLKLSSTNELTPAEASTVISLLAEALRLRADLKGLGS